MIAETTELSQEATTEILKKLKLKALELLTAREYTCAELSLKLNNYYHKYLSDLNDDIDLDEREEVTGQELINSVINHLRQNNQQSEYRAAQMYLKHGVLHGWGPNKIKQQMMQKGLDHTVIAQAFTQLEDNEDLLGYVYDINSINYIDTKRDLDIQEMWDLYWHNLAHSIALKKYGKNITMANNESQKFDRMEHLKYKAKIQRFLYSRGFDLDHIEYIYK